MEIQGMFINYGILLLKKSSIDALWELMIALGLNFDVCFAQLCLTTYFVFLNSP